VEGEQQVDPSVIRLWAGGQIEEVVKGQTRRHSKEMPEKGAFCCGLNPFVNVDPTRRGTSIYFTFSAFHRTLMTANALQT